MKQFIRKLPYFNKRIRQERTKGQSLVEFALVSVLLFTLIFGIMEMGRMMFIFSQVSSAAQEGARYGADHPRQVIRLSDDGTSIYPSGIYTDSTSYGAHTYNTDLCNIVSQARAKVTLINPNDVAVTVGFDTGNYNGGYEAPAVSFFGSDGNGNPNIINVGSTRVVVTATYQFQFAVGIFDQFFPGGMPITLVAARTITSDELDSGGHQLNTTVCGYDPFNAPTPTPAACNVVTVSKGSDYNVVVDERNQKWDLLSKYVLTDPYGFVIANGAGGTANGSGLNVTMTYYKDDGVTVLTTVNLTYSSTAGAWVGSSCNTNYGGSGWTQSQYNPPYVVHTKLTVSGSYTPVGRSACSVSPSVVKADTAYEVANAANGGTALNCPQP
jgi:Flp pilus assembly protein TadG